MLEGRWVRSFSVIPSTTLDVCVQHQILQQHHAPCPGHLSWSKNDLFTKEVAYPSRAHCLWFLREGDEKVTHSLWESKFESAEVYCVQLNSWEQKDLLYTAQKLVHTYTGHYCWFLSFFFFCLPLYWGDDMLLCDAWVRFDFYQSEKVFSGKCHLHQACIINIRDS